MRGTVTTATGLLSRRRLNAKITILEFLQRALRIELEMSQEPPRVVKPLPVQLSQGPRPLPDSNVRVRLKSNTGRYVFYGIVSLLSLMFICSGGAFFTYRKFNADSNFGGSYSELRLLVTFSGTDPEAFTDNPLNGLFASEARSQVTFHLQDFAGCQTAEQLELRTIAVDLLDGLPSAIAFQDPTQSSVYCGAGWKDRLKNAKGSAVDVGRPQEMYSSMLNAEASEPLVERSGKKYAVLDAGSVSELVPVSVEGRDTPWQKAVATTLAPSILVPSIAAGVRIEVNSDD